MDETITLSRSAFFQILDKLGRPGLDILSRPDPDNPGNPDNPFGPFGPGGPVMSHLAWVLLNPQPLPPSWRDHFAESIFARRGPQPDPWHPAATVQQVVAQAMAQLQMAEALSTTGEIERSIIVIGGYIHEIVDDWCGSGRPRWPWPKPRGWGNEEVDALDLLLAGREFQRLADALSENPLQNELASAASQLFEVGLSKLAG